MTAPTEHDKFHNMEEKGGFFSHSIWVLNSTAANKEPFAFFILFFLQCVNVDISVCVCESPAPLTYLYREPRRYLLNAAQQIRPLKRL